MSSMRATTKRWFTGVVLAAGVSGSAGCATTAAAPNNAAPVLKDDGRARPSHELEVSEAEGRARPEGRLGARPGAVARPGPRGLWTLDLGDNRRALLYVPPTLPPEIPSPLVVAFHGRHGSAELGLGVLRDAADANGFLLLAPEAGAETWDVLASKAFDKDLPFVDRALARVFALYPVAAEKIATAGFSDGASYALAVALSNGALFSHVMAYSPGMLRVKAPEGSPQVFVSHGIDDKVLPIGSSSRLLVETLRKNGYHVRFEEFRGGHSVPPELLKASVGWFFKTRREEPVSAPPAPVPEPDPQQPAPAEPGPARELLPPS